VGQINNALQETGLDKNTLLIFTSDNGPGPWAVKAMAPKGHASSATLRGRKADYWEGGHRIPFITKWPGRVTANKKTAAVINFTDLFATVAELLEVELPNSAADSHSFLPVLLDSSRSYKRPGMMVGPGYVRDGEWKLVSKPRVRKMDAVKLSQFGLYNLAEDLSEKNDVSKEHPERTERLFKQYRKYAENRNLK